MILNVYEYGTKYRRSTVHYTPQPRKQSSSKALIIQVEPKLSFEKLCKGFKKEQAERIAALKERCEAR